MVSFPTLSDEADITRLVQAIEDAIAAVDYMSQTKVEATGLTIEAGWSINSYSCVQRGGMAVWYARFTRTGAPLPVSAAGGDIPNVLIGTVKSEQRPITRASLTSALAGRGAFGSIGENGEIHLTAVIGTDAIATGEVLSLLGTGLV